MCSYGFLCEERESSCDDKAVHVANVNIVLFPPLPSGKGY